LDCREEVASRVERTSDVTERVKAMTDAEGREERGEERMDVDGWAGAVEMPRCFSKVSRNLQPRWLIFASASSEFDIILRTTSIDAPTLLTTRIHIIDMGKGQGLSFSSIQHADERLQEPTSSTYAATHTSISRLTTV
jgi:hypothetical protein